MHMHHIHVHVDAHAHAHAYLVGEDQQRLDERATDRLLLKPGVLALPAPMHTVHVRMA